MRRPRHVERHSGGREKTHVIGRRIHRNVIRDREARQLHRLRVARDRHLVADLISNDAVIVALNHELVASHRPQHARGRRDHRRICLSLRLCSAPSPCSSRAAPATDRPVRRHPGKVPRTQETESARTRPAASAPTRTSRTENMPFLTRLIAFSVQPPQPSRNIENSWLRK